MDLNVSQRRMLHKFYAYGFLKNLQFFDPFLLLFFTMEKGLSFTQFGVLLAVREATIVVLEVPTGIVADVTGRRRAMMLAFAFYLAAFMAFSLGENFWMFAPAMVLFGAGEAFRSGTHKAMIMEHLDLEGLSHLRVHYYGRTRGASRLGSAAASLLAAGVVFVFGLHAIFPATMLPYALAFCLMMTYPAELDGVRAKSRGALRDCFHHTVESMRAIRRTPMLARLLFNSAVFNAFFKSAKDYLQPMLATAALALPALAVVQGDCGKEAFIVGPVFFVVYIISFFSSRGSGRFTDRIGGEAPALNVLYWVFAVAFAAAGGFLVLHARSGWYWAGLTLSVGCLFLFYLLMNLRRPVATAAISHRADRSQRATILSVESQLRALVMTVVAPTLGYIADHGPWKVGAEDSETAFSPALFLAGAAVLLVLGTMLRIPTSEVVNQEPEE
jgi:MFS family permease